MSNIKTTFEVEILCPDLIPLITAKLTDWVDSQDSSHWLAHGYINFFTQIQIFIRSKTALTQTQVEELSAIFDEYNCAFLQKNS